MIRQPTNYTCGPIALFNLQKWAQSNNKLSYRTIYKKTQCNPINGTLTFNFELALEDVLDFNKLTLVKKEIQPVKWKMPQNEDQILIIEYYTVKKYLHFILIVCINGEIKMINEGAENKKIPIIQKFNLQFENYEKNSHKYPIVWQICKH